MKANSFCKINEIDEYDFLSCNLKRPISSKKIYKVMSRNDFEHSKANNYLHFNRVDSYPDGNDGMQLILDKDGNKNSVFESASNFNYFQLLNEMRSSTYACCFSLKNNSSQGENYGSKDDSGKVCLVFNLNKFLKKLELLSKLEPREFDQQIFLTFGEIKYINWKAEQLNLEQLQNYVTYLYLKDKKDFSGEQEFRLALLPNPLAIKAYKKYKGLHFFFDFENAIEEGVIEEIKYF